MNGRYPGLRGEAGLIKSNRSVNSIPHLNINNEYIFYFLIRLIIFTTIYFIQIYLFYIKLYTLCFIEINNENNIRRYRIGVTPSEKERTHKMESYGKHNKRKNLS